MSALASRRLLLMAVPVWAAGCASEGGPPAQTAASSPFALGSGAPLAGAEPGAGRTSAFTPATPPPARPAPAAMPPGGGGRGRALMAARLAEGPELAMILADDSGGLDQWLAPGPFVLALRAGRVARSVNLPGGDLRSVVDETPDPLARPQSAAQGGTYRRRLQLPGAPPGGLVVEGRLVAEAVEPVRVPGLETSRALRRMREVGRGLEGPVASWRFENLFWLEPATGRVMASRQQPLPSAPVLTLNVIRSAVG
jgi:hypothetical protein